MATAEPAPGQPRWLTESELAAWTRFVQLVTLLPAALDRQLREESGVPHAYYQILAMLSDAPDRAMRMSELARRTATSVSRLSHAVTSLTARGWVLRRPCPEDGRGQIAQLTDDGVAMLEATAPGHVAEVRRLVFDHLDPAEVGQLGAISDKLLRALEA